MKTYVTVVWVICLQTFWDEMCDERSRRKLQSQHLRHQKAGFCKLGPFSVKYEEWGKVQKFLIIESCILDVLQLEFPLEFSSHPSAEWMSSLVFISDKT